MSRRQVVLGIDPGTTGMGYALLDTSREPPAILERGLIPTPQHGTTAERLLAIATAIDGLIRAHSATDMALEHLYFNKNVRTAMRVAEARGVALVCAARARLTVAEYAPQEVKVAVTGSGSADKGQVQRMLHLVLGLDAPIAQDNIADAVAIALTHVHRSGFAAAVARAH